MGEALERTRPAAAPLPALAHYSDDDLELIRRFVAPNSSDHELAFFLEYAQAFGLNPFQGEIVGVPRWNAKAGKNVMTIQVTVRGERALAERTGTYAGQDPPEWCGPDGHWREVWLEKAPPAAARVAVYRHDWQRPAVGVARYSSYVQLGKNGNPTGLWATAPDLMLAKCAEAAALRKAAFTRGRDLSPASKVSMEARNVGLDDQGRHELVERVTDGRTSSTRDLTDEEVLEVRAEIARLGADPETGEILDEPLADEEIEPEEIERRHLAADLTPRARALSAAKRDELTTFLGTIGGAARKVNDYSLDELRQIGTLIDTLEKQPDPPPADDTEPF